ncbi:uncharacterized protein LOC34621180 [Cyclospora cayetanensis]|uniref:Uncharacterized protein LOC34621180 n=1 Tax=Cyclospora cayetanensis TaxID=88456 RepID=A0A6P6S0F2_9EIME|nr:uncharacterized protein LOC34621180 [Cyclospora cayetanensis]
MAKYKKDPSICRFCRCWSAWHEAEECNRCRSRIARHGLPKMCVHCNCIGAFPHSRPAAGYAGVALCFLCHWNIKKDVAVQLRARQRQQRTLQLLMPGKLSDLPPPGDGLPLQLAQQQQQQLSLIQRTASAPQGESTDISSKDVCRNFPCVFVAFRLCFGVIFDVFASAARLTAAVLPLPFVCLEYAFVASLPGDQRGAAAAGNSQSAGAAASEGPFSAGVFAGDMQQKASEAERQLQVQVQNSQRHAQQLEQMEALNGCVDALKSKNDQLEADKTKAVQELQQLRRQQIVVSRELAKTKEAAEEAKAAKGAFASLLQQQEAAAAAAAGAAAAESKALQQQLKEAQQQLKEAQQQLKEAQQLLKEAQQQPVERRLQEEQQDVQLLEGAASSGSLAKKEDACLLIDFTAAACVVEGSARSGGLGVATEALSRTAVEGDSEQEAETAPLAATSSDTSSSSSSSSSSRKAGAKRKKGREEARDGKTKRSRLRKHAPGSSASDGEQGDDNDDDGEDNDNDGEDGNKREGEDNDNDGEDGNKREGDMPTAGAVEIGATAPSAAREEVLSGGMVLQLGGQRDVKAKNPEAARGTAEAETAKQGKEAVEESSNNSSSDEDTPLSLLASARPVKRSSTDLAAAGREAISNRNETAASSGSSKAKGRVSAKKAKAKAAPRKGR